MNERRPADGRATFARPAAARLFVSAIEHPETERDAYLRVACGDDEELRTEVIGLLNAPPDSTLIVQTRTQQERPGHATQRPGEIRDRSGTMLSHFRLEERLGAGGMGEVYRAQDVALGRKAAVKLLRDAVDEHMRKRMVLEARTNARLEHPAIATFFESGTTDGVDFLAMEYVEGKSLRHQLESGPLEFDRALDVISTLLEAVVHTHAAGIVHRDIKPDNVMLTSTGMAKLLDFGIAKDSDSTESLDDDAELDTSGAALTGHGMIVGTIGYMSPEQIHGAAVSERTDIFAMGALMYEVLTGKPAFPGKSAADRIAATLSGEIPQIEIDGPDLDPVLQRALAHDPSDRYATAREFLADLRRLSKGEPVTALPNTIAVVDLKNEAAETDDEWIGHGIADNLGRNLARVASLHVVPRQRVALAARRTPDPGALGLSLGCRWVLTGTYRRDDSGLHLRMRLIEVATGNDIWTQNIDGNLDDIFAIQNRLAQLTAEALRIALPIAERPTSPRVDTFESYSRAQRLLETYERSKIAEAYDLLMKVIEVDPHHAPALGRLAAAHAPGRWTQTIDPRELEIAADYATRAIASDPDFPTGHVYLGYALWRQGLFEEALASLDRAAALDPKSWEAHYFRGCCLEQLGRWPEALEAQQRVVASGAQIPVVLMNVGICHFELGDDASARWTLEKAYEAEQAGTMGGWSGCGASLAECMRVQGELDAARALCLESMELIESRDHFVRAAGRVTALLALGRVATDQGDEEGARAALDQCLGLVEDKRFLSHVKIQAMCALSRATGSTEPYERAQSEYEPGQPTRFPWGGWSSDQRTLLELARAARTLGRDEECAEFERLAREYGALRPL